MALNDQGGHREKSHTYQYITAFPVRVYDAASRPVEAGAMLNFLDLASEISVDHEITESTAAVDTDDFGQSTD